MAGKSIFDKLWDRHVITGEEGQPQLMYVDQHYIHEVTSPQAFQGLNEKVKEALEEAEKNHEDQDSIDVVLETPEADDIDAPEEGQRESVSIL